MDALRSTYNLIGLHALLLILISCIIGISSANAALYETDKFKLTADFRLRLEQDWDSQRSDGTPRSDRLRLRIRARLGADYRASDIFSFGARIRTGSNDSQQSPHITIADFNNNDTGDSDINFDKWFVKAAQDGFSGWGGRNSFPFWKPNELFWDDDVTPAGVALSYKAGLTDDTNLTFNTGYFWLPAGMRAFSGNLGAGQVVVTTRVGEGDLTAAGGYFGIIADSTNSNNSKYVQGNGTRDYNIWVGNLQYKMDVAGVPLTFGGDYMHNAKNYSAAELAPFFSAVDNVSPNDTDGFDLYVQAGSLKKKGGWQGTYSYARIETFAVNNSFAQDDWVRWGSAAQTTGSNMKGHEFELGYAFSSDTNLRARLFIVESITNREDGNRFRLDFNHIF